MKNYHCCATCIHFLARRAEGQMNYKCKRLGFETKTHYQFNCWEPRDHIIKLIEKEQNKNRRNDIK